MATSSIDNRQLDFIFDLVFMSLWRYYKRDQMEQLGQKELYLQIERLIIC